MCVGHVCGKDACGELQSREKENLMCEKQKQNPEKLQVSLRKPPWNMLRSQSRDSVWGIEGQGGTS